MSQALPALLLAVTTLGATARGGRKELSGAAVFVLGWITLLALRSLTGGEGWRLAADLPMLVAFIALCWKAGHPWPIVACGLQSIAVASDVTALAQPADDPPILVDLAEWSFLGATTVLAICVWLPRTETSAEG